MALVPSIFARNGIECPMPGHFHSDDQHLKRKTCPVCGSRLVPWYGRLIITSSSGVSDGEDGFFAELVEKLEREPDPNFHLYKRDESANPKISGVVKGAVARVFGGLESTRAYVEAEIHNKATRKGEDFVSTSQIELVLDPELENGEGTRALAVGFLDTSISGDRTSLVISTDAARDGEDPWHRLETAHVQIWNPEDLPGGVIDERAIEQYLVDFVPLFPGLRVLVIDDHIMPWAIRMIKSLRRRPWGRIIQSANAWKGGESQSGWNLLEELIRDGRIRIQDLPEIRREFRGVRKRRLPDGSLVVEDRNRRKSHRDVTEAIACTCYLAHLESIRTRHTLSTIERRRPKELLARLPRPIVRIREEDL